LIPFIRWVDLAVDGRLLGHLKSAEIWWVDWIAKALTEIR